MSIAKNKASQIPKENRGAEIKENIVNATNNMKTCSKELGKKVEEATNTMNSIVNEAPIEHHNELSKLVLNANKLLAQLKGGADVNDIVKKLNNLRIK